jgi:hypothetical protein
MALTVETFLEDFPQFKGTKDPDKRIGNALRTAYLHAGEALGEFQDEAAGYYAAHLLATNPANENMAMVKGHPGTSIYLVQFDNIVRVARPIGTTSGDSPPPLPRE